MAARLPVKSLNQIFNAFSTHTFAIFAEFASAKIQNLYCILVKNAFWPDPLGMLAPTSFFKWKGEDNEERRGLPSYCIVSMNSEDKLANIFRLVYIP